MARVRVSQYVVEALLPTDTFSPTSITGCGVSQYVVEALVTDVNRARVSQYVVEVLMAEDDTQTPPGDNTVPDVTTHTYGYAV
jgi:hypothetical protein